MKPSTPGFVGDRLTEAREARGLTITAVADLTGVSKQSISQYEKSTHSPRPEVLQRIASVLNFPQPFFLQNSRKREDVAVYFRSFSAATKRARVRASWKIEWLQDTVSYLEQSLFLTESAFPLFDCPDDPLALSPQAIEDYAKNTRQHWGLGSGAIPDLVLLLENKGAIIARANLDAKTLDAFSLKSASDNRPYIFLTADKACAVRSRFDAAHELGHLILHQQLRKEIISSSKFHKAIESQANRFAGAFLLPEDSFLADLVAPTLDAFLALKEKWKVSVAAMIYRCKDLGIISDQQCTNLWVNYRRRKWSKNEPLDNKLPSEEPRLLRRSIELLLKQGVQSRADILAALPYSHTDIEELVGLPVNFLSSQSADITEFPTVRMRPHSSGKKEHEGKQLGNVIQLPTKGRQFE